MAKGFKQSIDEVIGENSVHASRRRRAAGAIMKQMNSKYPDQTITQCDAICAMLALEQAVVMFAVKRGHEIDTREAFVNVVQKIGALQMDNTEKAMVATVFDAALHYGKALAAKMPNGEVNLDTISGRNFQPSLAIFGGVGQYTPARLIETKTAIYALNLASVTAVNILERHAP